MNCRLIETDVSEEFAASTFRVQEYLGPEDGDS
jgi:hypothetical protein